MLHVLHQGMVLRDSNVTEKEDAKPEEPKSDDHDDNEPKLIPVEPVEAVTAQGQNAVEDEAAEVEVPFTDPEPKLNSSTKE